MSGYPDGVTAGDIDRHFGTLSAADASAASAAWSAVRSAAWSAVSEQEASALIALLEAA